MSKYCDICEVELASVCSWCVDYLEMKAKNKNANIQALLVLIEKKCKKQVRDNEKLNDIKPVVELEKRKISNNRTSFAKEILELFGEG